MGKPTTHKLGIIGLAHLSAFTSNGFQPFDPVIRPPTFRFFMAAVGGQVTSEDPHYATSGQNIRLRSFSLPQQAVLDQARPSPILSQMGLTSRVRKFALSVDPDELVDFVEPLSYFDTVLTQLEMEQVTPYRWRLKDQECTITADIQQSADGYEVWLTVQAVDAHEHRLKEIADAFDAYLLNSTSETRGLHRG